MLQVNEIQKRFTQIEQSIAKASQASQADTTLSKDVKDSIQQLDQQSDLAKKIMESKDEIRIRQAVEDLEKVGDRAEKACQSAKNVNEQVKSAISKAHTELSDLKNQLH